MKNTTISCDRGGCTNVITFDPRTGQPLWVELKLGHIGTSENKGLMFAHTTHVCPTCVEDLASFLPGARNFLGQFATRTATIDLPASPPVPADMSVTTSTGTLEAPFKIVRFEIDDEDAWVINDVRIKDGYSMASIFNESKALSVAEVNADVSAFAAAQIGQIISIIMTPKDPTAVGLTSKIQLVGITTGWPPLSGADAATAA